MTPDHWAANTAEVDRYRRARLRRWAMIAALALAALAIGHVAVKGAANVAHEISTARG